MLSRISSMSRREELSAVASSNNGQFALWGSQRRGCVREEVIENEQKVKSIAESVP